MFPEGRYDRVLEWYRKGTMQILDERPNIDYALRLPMAPHAAAEIMRLRHVPPAALLIRLHFCASARKGP